MTHSTERLSTALADRYRILRTLGAGGMATVYLAEDLKHERKVAVKVLKPELAAVLGAERFVVEIKTTAALSHPHILPLFDSGEADGFLYYVMPYIEGETIREKLNRETQFSIEEALRIATEIADALDYAHRHGIIHRDIKPENILLHDGRAMVMDFGIALAVSAAAGGRMTETGLSLGTPHYMSPEQATADKSITARSDLYSLASVLYEMLAGEPPHTGASAQQIVMKIIAERAQPVTELRQSVPLHVSAALERALAKLPADRFATLREFSQALSDPRLTAATTVAQTRAMRAGAGGVPRWLAALLGVGFVAASVFAATLQMRTTPTLPESRVAVALPVPVDLTANGGSTLAVSADGSMLAFVGTDSTGTSRVWVKRTDEITASPVLGTENARSPFLSPDGKELAYYTTSADALMAVALAGGRPREIARGSLGGNGGVWATDGYLYFDSQVVGIDRVRPDGTGRSTVIALDTARNETGYAWPEMLPGNKVLVARLRLAGEAPNQFSIVAIPLNGDPMVTLTRGVLARQIGDRLAVLRADGVLEAYPLKDGGLALDSAAVTLASDVGIELTPFGTANVATDSWGTLHYVSAQGHEEFRLVWAAPGANREYADSGLAEADARRSFIVPAPGGRRSLVVQALGPDNTQTWTRELPSGAMLPVAATGTAFLGGGWGVRDDSVMLAVPVPGGTEIRLQRADGLGTPVVIARDSGSLEGALTATRDFRFIVVQRYSTSELVMIDRLQGRVARTLFPVDTGFGTFPALSPDGRFLAYQVRRNDRTEIAVRPFPDVDSGIWQVSAGGGLSPTWSPRGDALFFTRPGSEVVLRVDVSTSPSFSHGRPQAYLSPAELVGLHAQDGFGISDDGARILVQSRVTATTVPQLVRVERP